MKTKHPQSSVSVLILLIGSFCLSGQVAAESAPVKPPPVRSWFTDMKEGRHIGKASGLLVLEISSRDEANAQPATVRYLLPIENREAKLSFVPDEHEIYDVSTKVYGTPIPKGSFVYKTYNAANALEITIGNKTYAYSVIDGGCDEGMRSLRCQYLQDEKLEHLVLVVEERIRLDCKNSTPEHAMLEPGTVVVFSHKKPVTTD